MAPLADADFCFNHAPESAGDRARARKKGGRNRRTPDGAAGDVSPPPLRDVASIQAVLEEVVRDTRLQENSARRSHALGYLLGVAFKALEVGVLEERLAALEERLAADPEARRIA